MTAYLHHSSAPICNLKMCIYLRFPDFVLVGFLITSFRDVTPLLDHFPN